AQDLKAIQSQIDSLQATVKALQKQVEDAKAQAAAAKTAAAGSKTDDVDLQVKWKGAPELSSKDGKFKLKVRGRVEAEYENVNQDTPITTFPDVSATEIRRARLGMEGIVFYDWKYILEVDFANDDARVRDAYLQYQGFKIAGTPLYFRVGNFKTPNSFENITSELYIDAMERAAFINAWELDRHVGFMTAYWTDHFGLAAGIFGEGGSQSTGSISNTPFFPGFIGDENLTFAARATVAPVNREVNGVPQVLAFGASVRTREVGDDASYLQYRARGADFHMTNFAVNTGRISDGDTFWGLEAAALVGPFSLQGEYGHLDVDLPGGSFIRNNSAAGTPTAPNPFIGIPDPEQTGWYVEGGWFFGGHKTYNKEGRWDRPKIDNPMQWSEHSGWGAVQLFGRYDVLDMSDTGNNAINTTFNLVGTCQASLLWP
ncbi:MAG: OprO/OprP family phosphate-selective porin, partial [Terriglobia bacterium]